MSEDIIGPQETGLWIAVSTDANDHKGERMAIPEHLMDGVLCELRAAATKRADYGLNAALIKWQALEIELPDLLDRPSLDGVLTMLDNATESLRVLYELAPEVYEDDDDQDDDEPDPEPQTPETSRKEHDA